MDYVIQRRTTMSQRYLGRQGQWLTIRELLAHTSQVRLFGEVAAIDYINDHNDTDNGLSYIYIDN